ncbi:MAG: MmgE/PrpD family protein [Casimicrobiaceae bacterium]
MAVAFADFVRGLRLEDIPEDVRRIMRRSFLDTIGVATIGSTTANSAIARRCADALWRSSPDVGSARMLLDGRRVSPAGAAFMGAATIDAIDAHDGSTPARGHAGSAVFPSLLAMVDAQASLGQRLDGRALLTLLAIGYETSYRAGLTQHATCADYHTSGAWTAVGVAAMAARMLDADANILRHAVGIAEYHGPRSQMMRCIDHPTMLRDGVAWGAPSGVTAAYLASMGFTGAPAITIEGEAAAPFWSDLGRAWRIVEHTHYKRYPVCRWAHPAIDAVRELMTENSLTSKDLAKVLIRTFHYATRLAGRDPRTLDEMTYAIIYPVATMAARGRIGVDELRPDVLLDPEIRRVAALTDLVESDHYTKISIDKRWADVVLTTTDGRVLQSSPKTPKGDPDDPLSDAEISQKFHAFADPILGRENALEIEAASHALDSLSPSELERVLSLVLERPKSATIADATVGERGASAVAA